MSTVDHRATALHAMGVASSADGRPGVAVRQLRAALRRVGDGAPELRGQILVSLAWAEAERGNIELGFRLLDEAETLIPAARRGKLLGQRGLLLRRSGQDTSALPFYDAAVAALRSDRAPLDLAKVLSNRGLLHLGAARVGQARADLQRSMEIANRHGFELAAATARHNLGDLELLSGDLPAALATYRAVAQVYQRLAPGKLAELSIDRARALLAAGLYGEADRELAAATEQARLQNLSHTHADALHARAEAALLAGQPDAARRWARRARARFLRRNNHRRAATAELIMLRAEYASGGPSTALITRARVLAEDLRHFGLDEDARVAGALAVRALAATGRVADAEDEAARLGRRRPADRLDSRLLLRLTSAEVSAAAGRRRDAFRHLAAGLQELQRYRSQLGCLDLQTGAAVHGQDLARAGLSAALANGSPRDVFSWAERVRAQTLLLPPARPQGDPDTVADLEGLRQIRHALRSAELAGRPSAGLRGRSETLQRRIRERSWAAAGPGTSATPATFRSICTELGDAALVSYVPDGLVLHALVLVDGSAWLVPLGRYAVAAEATLRLRADLDAQAGRVMSYRLARAVAEATRRDADALVASILDPVLPIVGDRDLVIVPTGLLVTVPWAVLPPCVGRPVTVAPSATTWRAARSRLRSVAAAAVPPLLVAGPGNDRGEPEVRSIAELRPGATVLAGTAATPAATIAALDGVVVAHLAAHGRHEPDNALFSELDLAGGPLMGYDLQHVGSVPPVVALSACDLGLSDVRPCDETLGMVTALLAAGSSTVIASVSRIADEASMAVMTAWHTALYRGRSPATALADAVPPGLAAGFVCFGAG